MGMGAPAAAAEEGYGGQVAQSGRRAGGVVGAGACPRGAAAERAAGSEGKGVVPSGRGEWDPGRGRRGDRPRAKGAPGNFRSSPGPRLRRSAARALAGGVRLAVPWQR